MGDVSGSGSRAGVAWAGLPPSDIPKHWHLVEPLLREEAEREGTFTPAQILRDCLSGARQLWMVHEDGQARAVVVTEILDLPKFKSCDVLILKGEGLREWLEFIGVLKAWGRAQGATRFRVVWARPGFEKVLKMKRSHVCLEEEL